MSAKTLRQFEGDVEMARAKLTGSLATLRSPDTLSAFTDDLKKEALDTKDALIGQAKAAAQSKVTELVEDLKAKAAANPAAALAIGAGLAWHFLRRLLRLSWDSAFSACGEPPHLVRLEATGRTTWKPANSG